MQGGDLPERNAVTRGVRVEARLTWKGKLRDQLAVPIQGSSTRRIHHRFERRRGGGSVENRNHQDLVAQTHSLVVTRPGTTRTAEPWTVRIAPAHAQRLKFTVER